MDAGQLEFQKRLSHLGRKQGAVSHGHVTGMRPDGVIVARPRAARPVVSGRAVLLILAVFFVLKGVLLASVGVSVYYQCIAKMRDGTVLEKAGAIVMQPDPLSRLIAAEVRAVLR